MPKPSTRYDVLIASPGDLTVERDVVDEVIREWNSSHSRATGIMLYPLRWELDSTPEMGDRAQGIINKQLVDHADIVIALFATRLGSPTGVAVSGTAEEIERMRSQGKRVMVYFSTAPPRPDHNVEQLRHLKEYKSKLISEGLYFGFTDDRDLRDKVSRHIANVMSGEHAFLTSTVSEQHGSTSAVPLTFNIGTRNIVYDLTRSAWREANQFDSPGEFSAALICWFGNPVPSKGMRGVDASGVVAHLKFRIPQHETVQISRAYWLHHSESRIDLKSGCTRGVLIGVVKWNYWEGYVNPYERSAEEEFLQPAFRPPGQAIQMPKSNMHVEVSLISPDGTTLEVKWVNVEFRNGSPTGVVMADK